MKKTGWPPGLLQDDCSKLSRWFASRPDARYQIRMMFPKHEYVRSPKLLKAVRELSCQSCGSDYGIQAAHSNWGGGKGRSIKADDSHIAALCPTCHHAIDQGNLLSREQRMKLWVVAHYRTVRKLTQSGMWPSEVPIPFDQQYEDIWNEEIYSQH
jgi:hypothetical protein